MTVVAISALFVSVLSTILAGWTAFIQRRHMQLSVRPLADISFADFEDHVGVFLRNSGIGPMRIVSCKVIDSSKKALRNVVDHMPPLEPEILWSNFLQTVDGRPLEAGSNFELLSLRGDVESSPYVMSRDRVRNALSRLKVVVEYEDLYGRHMNTHERKLDWFARHAA